MNLTGQSPKIADRASWMQGKYGLIVHWIYPTSSPQFKSDAADFDSVVDGFNVDGFVADFLETGAEWLMFTLAQNTGFYASPNQHIDALLGLGHTSRRDLVLELATQMKRHGKRFVAYLPSEVHYQAEDVRQAFGWNRSDQNEFQHRYTEVIREYALRYGGLLDGWWFDGCYDWDEFHSSTYDWDLWSSAARAGNFEACLSFNDGSFFLSKTTPVTPYQDYLSGEIGVLQDGKIRLGMGTDPNEEATLYMPDSRFVGDGHCQWHGMLPMDCNWVHSGGGLIDPPRYSDEELGAFVAECLGVGGAVTLNIGIYREGRLAGSSVEQLKRLL